METILILERRNGGVRSIDVANELGYSKPSISRAMSILKSNGFIAMEEGGPIHLTELGREKAEAIYERHRIITEFLQNVLGVSKETAGEDACRVEHVISQETFACLKQFVQEREKNEPAGQPE